MNRYPEEQWAEILGNCDTQIMLGCTEEQTANYWSMRSGDMSVEVNSTMTVRKTIAVAQLIPQYRHTEGLGKRRLLTPDEVFRLRNDEMLIILRGEKMLRALKFDYTGHPYAKYMTKDLIYNYIGSRTRNENPDTRNNNLILQTENKTDKSGSKNLIPELDYDNILNSYKPKPGKPPRKKATKLPVLELESDPELEPEPGFNDFQEGACLADFPSQSDDDICLFSSAIPVEFDDDPTGSDFLCSGQPPDDF